MNERSLSIAEFGERHGICRVTIYKLISSGALRAVKIGRRTVIPAAAEQNWLASLQPVNKSAA